MRPASHFLPAAEPDPRHPESAQVQRRRRTVVVITLVAGAVLLGIALNRPRGGNTFYASAAGLALIWLVGGLLSGPLHLGGRQGRSGRVRRRQFVGPAALGALAFAVFALGAEAVSWIPTLHHAVDDVIERADTGSRALIVVITLVNGVAEEVFFRGALYSAFGRRRPVLWTTVCYVAVTAASGNGMLVFGAAVMGLIFAWQRRVTQGILAPAITHVTWSTLMIFFLPR